jgi:hypothetical protein
VFQLQSNGLQNACQVFPDIVVPESDDAISMLRQFLRTPLVGSRLDVVLSAVQLNDELVRRAGEIGYAVADGMLPAKAQMWKRFA